MSIKVYSGHKNLKYKYSRSGTYRLQLTNNVSSAVFSGEELNGIRTQLAEVANLDTRFTKLGDNAFAECAALTAVNFNETIQTVGKSCFKNCVNLPEVCLSPSLEQINDDAFSGDRSLTCLSFKHFEDDEQDGATSYKLAAVGDRVLNNAARCTHVTFPNSIIRTTALGNSFLANSSVTSLTFLGATQAEIMKSTESKCFGVGHDCCVYTSDGKMALYSSASNSFTDDPSYSMYRGMKISTGKKDRMTLGKKIYEFTEELFKWCVVPSTQDPAKFPQRACPTVTIFCDLATSVKSQIFAENVLKQQALHSWMKETLNCYVFLMNRNGKIQPSESSPDLSYYRTFFNQLGASKDFVSVNFYYNGKFTCATLKDLTLDEFKKVVLDGCSKTGFSNFNSDGYSKIGDEPEPETAPSRPVDQQSIAAFHNGGFDWYQNGNAVSPTSWNIASSPMDFGLVATPDTTYVLVCGYDMKYSTDPQEVGEKLFPIFKEFSDHAFYYERCSRSNKKFLPGIAEGLKYRYLIFFEFSHGNTGIISIDGGVSKTEMWNALAPAKNRIFGMFDSCHSGSMFKAGQQKQEEDDDFDMAEYLVGKFNRRKLLMSRLFGASTAAIDPYILMWSSTKANTYGWYYPQTATVFQRAICKAYGEMPHSRFAEIFPYVQKYGDEWDEEHGDYSTPQQKTYNVDFTKNKIFT